MGALDASEPSPAVPVVLDTNIVLDLFVFADEATQSLREALAEGRLHWHATAPMREELARVLAYPQIARRLAFHERSPEAVLAAFDQGARLQPMAPRAAWTCKDPDDQKFIDLAAALPPCILLSKDQAVLCMRRRLAGAGVSVLSCWPAVAAG